VEGKSNDWIMSHVRATKQTVFEELKASGFELYREINNFFVDNYFTFWKARRD